MCPHWCVNHISNGSVQKMVENLKTNFFPQTSLMGQVFELSYESSIKYMRWLCEGGMCDMRVCDFGWQEKKSSLKSIEILHKEQPCIPLYR